MTTIKIFAPATIANVSCGFDILGLCLDTVGDEMIITKSNSSEVKITKIHGENLPLEAEKNVAGVAAIRLLEHLNIKTGFDIEIFKNIKPGSGIGSSAASAAGAVFGINKLLGSPLSNKALIPFAMQGEKLASGSAHADNVSPALLGGFTMVTRYNPLNVIKINAPSELYATVVHPQIELKTADSRAVLKQNVTLKSMVNQMGYFGGLISGLYTENYEVIAQSLNDDIIEPYRSILIPEYKKAKATCKTKGALGSGISGSGPSIFALSRGEVTAKAVGEGLAALYKTIKVNFDIHISKINADGIKILNFK